MRICITGACGFIGSQLFNQLMASGCDVIGIDNLSAGRLQYVENAETIFDLDIRDTNALSCKLEGVDLVIHLAAAGSVVESIVSPLENFRSNVEGTISVLEAIRRSQVKQIIFASTGGALMGNTEPPISECTLPDPISPYGASKLSCEGYIKAYAACYNIRYTIFRFANVFGPNSLHKRGVFNKFFENCSMKSDIEVFGDVSRDFIYSQDLVKILQDSIWMDNLKCQTVLIASGIEVEIKQLAKLYLSAFGMKAEKLITRPNRCGEVSRVYADNSKFLNFFPDFEFTTFEKAVLKTIGYLRDERI